MDWRVFVEHAPALVLAGLLGQLGLLALCLVGILALRFLRRGEARFWMAPATAALALLPAVFAVGFTALVFKRALGGLALTGSGGLAAVAAGAAEALIPMLLGVASVAILAFVGFVVTAAGSERAEDDPRTGGPAATLAALAAAVLVAGLAAWMVRLVSGFVVPSPDTQGLLGRWWVAMGGAVFLAVLLCLLAVATALRAPRGAPSVGLKLAALLPHALAGAAALVGGFFVQAELQRLSQVAVHGTPDGTPRPEDPEPSLLNGEIAPADEAAVPALPNDAQPIRVGGAITEPRKVRNVAPVYPEIARQARVQGIVILEATIDATGKVTEVTVLRGVPLLDQAAIEAVRQWEYTPTLLDGKPVPVIMTITVNFKLSS
jgi:TonB family protein